MAEPCKIEVAGLPVLTDCPADSEYVMFINATGGYSQYGYALRSWAKVKECLASPALYPGINQVITVGDETGYEVVAPDGGLIVENSLWVSLSGVELPMGLVEDRISYTPNYNEDGTVDVEFFNNEFPLPPDQPLIFHYLYTIPNA